MGSYYARSLSGCRDASLQACCDPTPEKLRSFAGRWEIPGLYTDWRDLCGDGSLTGVINASMDALHRDVLFRCVESGIPLLTEKPLACPLKDLKSLGARRVRSFPGIINFSKRQSPAVEGARSLIGEGRIGTLHRMELHYRQGWALNHDFGDWHEDHAWTWRLSRECSPQGVLGDLGSHLFDLAEYLAGPVEALRCSTAVYPREPSSLMGYTLDSPDEAAVQLSFRSGVFGLLNATRTAPGEKDSLTVSVHGSRGSLKLDLENSRYGVELFDMEKGEWETLPCKVKPAKNYEHFCRLLGRSGESSGETGNAGIPGMKAAVRNQLLIEAAAESARGGREIQLRTWGDTELGGEWEWIHRKD